MIGVPPTESAQILGGGVVALHSHEILAQLNVVAHD